MLWLLHSQCVEKEMPPGIESVTAVQVWLGILLLRTENDFNPSFWKLMFVSPDVVIFVYCLLVF